MVVTSGGLNKPKAYKRLKIPEVWFWQNGTLAIYHLREIDKAADYEQLQVSEELPGLDIALLLKCINMPRHVEAVNAFRQALKDEKTD